MQYCIDQFAEAIRAAAGRNAALQIRGGGTKNFYGNYLGKGAGQAHTKPDSYHNVEVDFLDVASYAGMVDYEPTELVVTARSGTRLADLEIELYKHGQMLAFEPPHFGPGATLGGCIATGLSGPRRASAGAARDFVLGIRMLDGRGDDLSFGGQVMKNVAGYDVSRLMAGSMGTLGVLLEVSLKVLPIPAMELTLRFEMDEAEAIESMNNWAGKPLAISATCFCDGELTLRLSGAEPAVRAAHAKLGGDEIPEGKAFWASVREQTHPFFQEDKGSKEKNENKDLWRLSIKSTTPPLLLPGKQLIEWGGALRWLIANHEDAERVPTTIRQTASDAGGHATLFRTDVPRTDVFQPLAPAMMTITRRLKEKFDPKGLFNPGRMYPQL
jgi:glycolate oxidase FAD binding subunit